MSVFDILGSAKDAGIYLYLDQGRLRFKAKTKVFPEKLRADIDAHKVEIMGLLSMLEQETDSPFQLGRMDRQEGGSFPLSSPQERLWTLGQLSKLEGSYNISSALRWRGLFDTNKFDESIQRLVNRHEIVRTNYVKDEFGVPAQIVRGSTIFRSTVADVSELSVDEQQTRIFELLKREQSHEFDLETDLMLRVLVIRKHAFEHIVLLTMHHIASDGWSMEIVRREVMESYIALIKQQEPNLPDLPVQYLDYVDWQSKLKESSVFVEQLTFWRKQLHESPPVHSLPIDYPRPAEKLYRGATVHFKMPKEVASRLSRLSRRLQISPFMLLHAAICTVFSAHSNSSDIIVGTPVSGRENEDLQNLVGFFVNNLVLRVDTNHQSFLDYIEHVKKTHIDAHKNQHIPFEYVVNGISKRRNLSYMPVFQIMLQTGMGFKHKQEQNNGYEITPLSLSEQHCKYDLDIYLDIGDESVDMVWNYDISLFKKSRIKQLASHLSNVLEQWSHLSDLSKASLSELLILSDSERDFLINEFNDTGHYNPPDLCVHNMFERQATKIPDQVAIELGESEITYRELDCYASRLAEILRRKHNIGPDCIVGLYAERSLGMAIAIIAILKSGGAYLPLDPEYPVGRLEYMVEDAALSVILTTSTLSQLPFEFLGDVLSVERNIKIDVHDKIINEYPDKKLIARTQPVSPSNLAYVIYTSGSTGQPKGVMVEHKAIVNRIEWMHRKYGMSRDDKVLQKTPYSFDVSVWEFLWTLGYGGKLVMAYPGGHKEPDYICHLIQKRGITKLHFTPSMLELVLENPQFGTCNSLQQVFCSGEPLTLNLLNMFKAALPETQIHNLYGPTEAAIDVSSWDCSGNTEATVPIGIPIDNTQLFILSSNMQLVPQGAVGELYIGGAGLARGYLNRKVLTEERFVLNPFFKEATSVSSERLYRTGDLVRMREDAAIEYIGRTDHQIKIRGFRVELGEIEYHVEQLTGVISAHVVVREEYDTYQIFAYVRLDSIQLDEETKRLWRSILAHNLPDYMLPRNFISVDVWPRTASGKIDKNALPVAIPDRSNAITIPKTATEQTLRSMWSELLELELEQLSIASNFFELGGHSLLGMRMLNIVNKHFNISISVRELLKYQDIISLARLIDEIRMIAGDNNDRDDPDEEYEDLLL